MLTFTILLLRSVADYLAESNYSHGCLLLRHYVYFGFIGILT